MLDLLQTIHKRADYSWQQSRQKLALSFLWRHPIKDNYSSKDYFYICVGHLQDRGFCLPDPAEQSAIEERRKKEDLEKEIANVKREYEEKQKRKKDRENDGNADDAASTSDKKKNQPGDDKVEKSAKLEAGGKVRLLFVNIKIW